MRNVMVCGLVFIGALSAGSAAAEWKGKGEAGIVFARGNTKNDNVNVKLGMATDVEKWKHGFDVSAFQASNNGNKTANRYGAGWQSDYKLSERSYWFGGLHYDADKFSGFDYQTSLTTGYGYKFFDTDTYKFSGQLGAGYRRSKNSLTGLTKGDAIATAGLNLERALTDTTKLFDKLTIEAGSSNTFAANDIGLQVKMSDKFAVSLGLGLRYNTKPPVGLKKSDTLTTVNLVYAF